MSTTAPDEVDAIMDRVRRWPSPTRIALARRILESLETPVPAEPVPDPPPLRPLRGVPVAAVAGRYRGDGPPPTDEESQQILEEELWNKYMSPR